MLGCDGKQVLTASQAVIANDVFTPSDDEIRRAQTIVAASEAPHPNGIVAVDGQNVDRAAVHAAADTVAKAEAIARR